jgi:transposase-like protein
LVQALLNGQTALGLGKEHNISPGLINRWKRQYLNGRLGKNNNNKEIKKLQIQIAKLEQMIGKLTMENYVLKKKKEYIIQTKKEDSSIRDTEIIDIYSRKIGYCCFKYSHS